MTRRKGTVRVLAIDPTCQGFGFVVMEGADQLIDWGTAWVPLASKNSSALNRVRQLLRTAVPDVLVLEDPQASDCRRCDRVRRLLKAMLVAATEAKIKVWLLSPSQVRRTFELSRARSKDHRAAILAARFPHLAPHLPRVRRPWTAEDERMGIFDAAAMAVTFFASTRRRA